MRYSRGTIYRAAYEDSQELFFSYTIIVAETAQCRQNELVEHEDT